MSESIDLDLWKRRRMLEMQRRLLAKKSEEAKKLEESQQKERMQPREILKKIFVGRAMEVWDLAWKQYPEVMKRLEPNLARLVLLGEVNETLDESQLLLILRTIGLKPRFDVKIRILEDGRYKTISEKLKEG
ncbi:MAG: DNA-binding protein [Candidatus Bathyarchaeia archaeon]